jgi:hypothetical protein
MTFDAIFALLTLAATAIIAALLLTYLGAPVYFRDWRKTGARLARFWAGFLRQSAPVLGGVCNTPQTGATGATGLRLLKCENETGAKTGAKPEARMIALQAIPKPGTTIDLDGQSYRLIETAPFMRRDGFETTLATWRANCADCGVEFETRSGMQTNGLNRRCDVHRKSGKPVKGSRYRKVQVAVIEP